MVAPRSTARWQSYVSVCYGDALRPAARLLSRLLTQKAAQLLHGCEMTRLLIHPPSKFGSVDGLATPAEPNETHDRRGAALQILERLFKLLKLFRFIYNMQCRKWHRLEVDVVFTKFEHVLANYRVHPVCPLGVKPYK